MAKLLGFRCTCKQYVFASTDYFGEQVRCDACGQWVRIPLMFYCKIPAHYYTWVFLSLMIVLSVVYLKFGHIIGRTPGSSGWLALPWVALISLVFCYWIPKSCMFSAYWTITKKDPLERRGLVTAMGGDDICLYLPIATFLALLALYAGTHGSSDTDILGSVRGPWMFALLGGAAAAILTTLVASLAFRFAPRKLRKFLAP